MAIESDPLFAGLTRPASLFGLPTYLYGIVLVVPLVAAMWGKSVYPAAAIPALYGIFRQIIGDDPRTMHHLWLRTRLRILSLNRSVWRSNSYAPQRFKKRVRNVD